jgi:hypothetical protein
MKVSMCVDVRHLVFEAIEEGLRGGWHKAHKHTNTPDLEEVIERQLDYISLAFEERRLEFACRSHQKTTL